MIETYFQSLVIEEDTKYPPNMVHLLEPSTEGPLKAYPVKKKQKNIKTPQLFILYYEKQTH